MVISFSTVMESMLSPSPSRLSFRPGSKRTWSYPTPNLASPPGAAKILPHLVLGFVSLAREESLDQFHNRALVLQ